MKRSTSVAAAGWLAVLTAGCLVGDPELSTPVPTFEEFRDSTYKEPWEDGVYIVNGDTPIADEKALQEFYDSIYGSDALIVHQSGGIDAKWNDTQKMNLTYCISNNFGSNKAKVVEAFRQATDLGWETMGRVNFVYVSAQDASCTSSNTNVLFDVRPVNSGGAYLARAFFPGSSRSSRNVLIDNSALDPNLSWPLKNIVAHELGHTLGFRHEHTRPEAGRCFEDNNWRPLTPYDSASVMHYPQCNGTSTDLRFTTRDAQGIAALYGAPGGGDPPPPGGVDRTQNWSGTVAANQGVVLSPTLNVVPGSTLTVTMTGSGDPDLYVRFGAAPTLTSYACRPYTSTANEQCSLTVPSGQTTAYVGVVGYRTFASSSYQITARYRSPN